MDVMAWLGVAGGVILAAIAILANIADIIDLIAKIADFVKSGRAKSLLIRMGNSLRRMPAGIVGLLRKLRLPKKKTRVGPSITVSLRVEPSIPKSREKFQLIVTFQNEGSQPAISVEFAFLCPTGLALIAEESDSIKSTFDIAGHGRVVKRYQLQAQDKMRFRLPALKLEYLDRASRHYSTFTPSLDILIEFNWHPDFVNREGELAQLDELLDRATKGIGQLAFVHGIAGVGKSRLVRHLVEATEKQGFLCLVAKCAFFQEGIPFYPVKEVLRQALRLRVEVPREEQVQRLSDELDELAPAVADVAPALVSFIWGDSSTFYTLKDIDSTPDMMLRRESFFNAVLVILKVLCDRQPVLLWLDDLQWLDTGTMDLIRFLAYNIAEMRILAVGSFRTEEATPLSGNEDRNLLMCVHQLRVGRLCAEVELGPLGEDSTLAIAKSIFPTSAFSTRFAKVLFRETEGNPLFIVEVLRSLTERGLIRQDGRKQWAYYGEDLEIAIPETVEKTISMRLSRLASKQLQVLEIASCIGREFPIWLFDSLVKRNGYEAMEYLRIYVRAGLLRETDPKQDSFRFTHSKIQEVVYSNMLFVQKVAIHSRIAELFLKRYEERINETAFTVASHYLLGQKEQEALTYLMVSARENTRTFNNEEALRQYNMALEILDRLDQRSPENIRRRITILREVGHVHKHKGDLGSARQSLEESLTAAERSSHELGPAPTQAWIVNSLGDLARLEGDYEKAEKLYSECLQRAKDLKSEELTVETLNDLGSLYYFRGLDLRSRGHIEEADKAFERVEECSTQVRALVEDWTDKSVLRRAYNNLANVYLAIGDYENSIPYYERSLEIAIEYKLEQGAHSALGDIFRHQGDLERATLHYQAYLEWAKKVGARRSEVMAYGDLGIISLLRNDNADALNYFDRAIALNQYVDYKHFGIIVLILKGIALYNRGQSNDDADALELFKGALRLRGTFSDADDEAAILRKVGMELHARGEFELARTFFQHYLGKKPEALTKEMIEILISAGIGVDNSEGGN